MCPQWEEASSVDDDHNSVRTYEICTPSSTSSYWLRTSWIPLKAATTLYVEIWLVDSFMSIIAVQNESVTPERVAAGFP